MAYFAELDGNNIVINVHRVHSDALDSNDEENSGIAFLTEWSGKPFKGKKCAYDGSIRKNYPGVGFFYDEQKDAFIAPKPFDSWTLNPNTCLWEPPVPRPIDDKIYNWDEVNSRWELIE
jgi:hypothetical protein